MKNRTSIHRRLSTGTLLAGMLALATACAPRQTTAPSPVVGLPAHRIYDTDAERYLDFEALADRAAGADVVVFGELHDDPGTHQLERALLEALARRRGDVVLSLEMFERDVQPTLDAYLAGEIDEAAFLATSRPWNNYPNDYRPLVEIARARGLPVIASNVPRPLAARVSREGLGVLDALSAEERATAAAEIICPEDRYYQRFIQVVGAHGDGSEEGQAMADRFYQAQCVKDETMAESIVAALAERPGSLVVHMTGSFHSDYGLGTVERIARRAPELEIVVLSALPLAELDSPPAAENAELADYLIFTVKP